MKVELYFWAGCPSYPEAEDLLREVIDAAGIDAEIARVEVHTEDEAQALGFVGSPTIRIDGRDVDEDAVARSRPSLTCRIYIADNGAVSPVPSRTQLERALSFAGATR